MKYHQSYENSLNRNEKLNHTASPILGNGITVFILTLRIVYCLKEPLFGVS